MNYIIKPTLERRALFEIVISLWNCSSVRSLIDKFLVSLRVRSCHENNLYDCPSFKKAWKRIGNTVVKNVPHLLLPESLKKKILHLIKPVGMQILHWMEDHKFCNLDVMMRNKLCWKQQGTVDRKRTAEALVNDDSLDVTFRYQLACINCLKDDILQSWNNMPANWSEYKSERSMDLTAFWTYDINGEISRISRALYHPLSLYQFAFDWAALSGNKVATEYFFKKLTHEEKKESLVKTATKVAKEGWQLHFEYDDVIDYPTNVWAEVLCFLLSQMDDDQQLQVYRNSPYGVLRCLLDWPWQHFFMEAANHMWEFMSGSCFYRTLKVIAGKAFFSYKGDCYYQELFTEFWQHGLTTHRRYVVEKCGSDTRPLLTILFLMEDKENIRLILKQATDEEKERIVFLCEGMGICEDLIYNDKWDLFTIFVEQCISSTNMRIKLKKKVEHVMHNCHPAFLEDKPNMCKKLRCILDDLIYNDEKKRSMEESETSSTKKFCNTQ